jgi:hypothetical protein
MGVPEKYYNCPGGQSFKFIFFKLVCHFLVSATFVSSLTYT